MSNLDVALRLRLINQLGGPAKDAKRELEGIGSAAKKLDGAKAEKLAQDLARTKSEATAAGAALNQTAAGAKKLDQAKSDRLARDIAKTKTEATAAGAALEKTAAGAKKLDQAKADRLASDIAKTKTEATAAGVALDKTAAGAKKLDQAQAGKLARDIAKTRTEATAAGAALEKTAAGVRKLDPAKADRLARGLGKSKTEAIGSERALRQVVNALRQLDGTRAERLVASLRRANTAAESLARSLRRVRTEGHGVGGDGSGGGLKRPTASGGGMSGALVAGGARMLGVVGAGYLAYRTAANSVRTVVDQDKAWAEVRKKVEGTPEQLAALQVQLRAQARKYGLSIAEIFEQAAEAGAAGIEREDLTRFVELTTRASVGWGTTARETAQRIAEIKAGTSMTLPEIDQLANKISALGLNSAAKERDIVEMFHRSGAAAKAAGVQYDDTLAILTAIRSSGMQEEVASRWFNAFAFDIAGSNAKGDKVKEAWKRLGFNTKDLAQGMKTNATGTIMKVFEAINKLEQTKKVEVLSAIFGQGWQDETARAAQAIKEIKKQLDFVHDPANWQGKMQSSLDIQLSTVANHWERIKTAATEVANQIDRATGASKGFNSVTESLLQTFERWIGKGPGAEGKKPGPEQPRADEPAGPKSRFPGRMQSYEHARATREALRARAPKLSDFSGRNQMEDYKRAKAKYEAEQRAMRPARGPMTPVPATPNFTPAPVTRPTVPLPQPRPTARNYTPTPPDAAANALRQIGSPVPPAAADQAETTLRRITQAVTSEGAKAVAESRSAAEQVRALWNFSVSPQITPRFGGAGGSASGGVGTGSGSASPAPAPAPAAPSGKRAELGRGSSFQIGAVHINGAGKNGRALAQEFTRELAKLGDSSSALHDTV